MTEQKTYDFEGIKLVKVPDNKKGTCEGCFFNGKPCLNFIMNVSDCEPDEGSFIFIEAKNEPVNKID